MNFFQVKEKPAGRGVIDIYPDFMTVRSSDLMVRGNRFYAIWDEEKQAWSTDEYDVQRIIDDELTKYYQENKERYLPGQANILYMKSFRSKTLLEFKKFVSNMADNYHQLDEKVTFTNTETKRSDYVSMHVPYPLLPGPCDAYDELIGTLYSEEERRKFEWAIGSIIAGDSRRIQKFIVFYGEGGTGKSTVLNIIQALFQGYYTVFNSKTIGSGERFCLEPFKSNPLVGIEHDGDLSKIADNTKLNQIVAHEEVAMDLKNIPIFNMRINSFLFMGTNKPVQITDAKSGLIRRLIDVTPSGDRLEFERYNELMERIDFEKPAIAAKCLDIYRKLGKSYYNSYVPRNMMYETDPFYNYVEDCYFTFKEEDGTTLKSAYELYKNYCDDAGILTKLTKHRFRSELKNYFNKFDEMTRIDGKQVRSYYSGFKYEKFDLERTKPKSINNIPKSNSWLDLKEQHSIFDDTFSECPAQYAVEAKSGSEVPSMAWAKVITKLKDIDTSKVHYCMPPENLVTIDFDIKDENGNKSFEKNLEAASKWPPTYAELSKGGSGIHLEYFYTGDISKLSSLYEKDVEVKTYTGRSSLRRRLSKCNDIPIATISSGLPLKEARKTVNFKSIANEKALRTMIENNLQKKYNDHTRPSIDFIFNDLEAAYNQGLKYDVSDMRQKVMTMACKSTHQAEYCIALVGRMKFKSDEPSTNKDDGYSDDILIFFDCEVFPNLFIIVWKRLGDPDCVRMINPTPAEVRKLLEFKLIGFNNRRYDNHILYARAYKNYTNEQLFELSKRIVGKENSRAALSGEAFNASYTDIYDFCATKQSLKKWEIELDISHKENDLPWDQPVPEDKWMQVAEYCENDVRATEATFLANQQDFKARQMLADISKKLVGFGTVNDTTNQLTTRIILRGDKDAYKQFVYPDLSKEFPGYEFNPIGFPEERYSEVFEKSGKRLSHKSFYKGCDPSEGGRVYANPGGYCDVWTFDVASMHPSSMIAENAFGKYTKNLKDLLDIRLCIKHGEYEKLYDFFDGALAPYADEIINEKDKGEQKKKAKALSYALKIAINSVYGLTSAKFDNPLRDPRNVDNWVAKRGALFMINLQKEVEARGFTVVHVKTDSIKVAKPTDEIKEFIISYGKKFGYNFEIEAIYDRICLVNRAVYIARYSDKHPEESERGKWTATGDQFKQPFVFKTLFSKEPIEFNDMCETKTVQTALYLDFNENLPEDQHNYHFVGKAGRFCPILPGYGGGRLVRDAGEGKFNNAEGSTGYRWMEAEVVKANHLEDKIDISYYRSLADQAKTDISKFVDFEMFASDDQFEVDNSEAPPWDD